MRWTRKNLQHMFFNKIRRAWAVTRYCKNFNRFSLSGLNLLLSLELKLTNVLLRIKFAYLLNDAEDMVRSGLIYVNGLVCSNINYIVKKYDRIQFILAKNTHLQHRQLLSFVSNSYNKLKPYVYSKLNTHLLSEKMRGNFKAVWPYKTIWSKLDIPKYYEVDYLTMTAFVLYTPFHIKDFFPYYLTYFKFMTARSYNWRFFYKTGKK